MKHRSYEGIVNLNDINTNTMSLLGQKVVQRNVGLLALLLGCSGVEPFGCTIREMAINEVKQICIP
jgi:hypothetical protein